jgi:mycothiol system anti-sigma-R factor
MILSSMEHPTRPHSINGDVSSPSATASSPSPGGPFSVNCFDCQQRLDSFLDRELSPTERLQVQFHLDACPHCADGYEFQAKLNRLVRSSCAQDLPPLPFQQKLRDLIA